MELPGSHTQSGSFLFPLSRHKTLILGMTVPTVKNLVQWVSVEIDMVTYFPKNCEYTSYLVYSSHMLLHSLAPDA